VSRIGGGAAGFRGVGGRLSAAPKGWGSAHFLKKQLLVSPRRIALHVPPEDRASAADAIIVAHPFHGPRH